MDDKFGGAADLARRRDGLESDASYLEHQVQRLRARTDLRTVYWRLCRTALWTLPLIWLGVTAARALEEWWHIGSKLKALFL